MIIIVILILFLFPSFLCVQPTAEELAEIAEIEKEEREAKAAAEKVEPSAKKKKDTKTFKVHDEREHLNIVFIGHVDAGKSTISGSALVPIPSLFPLSCHICVPTL